MSTSDNTPQVSREAFEQALQTLTDLERKVLAAAWLSSAGNGHAFGVTTDLKLRGLSQRALGGVITSLQNKGILACFETDVNGRPAVQFALGDFGANEGIRDAWRPAAAVAVALTAHGYL